MESVILRRIYHRDKDRLAMFFKSTQDITAAVRNIDGVKFSITHKCWYVDDSLLNLELILKHLNTVANIDQSELHATTVPPSQKSQVSAGLPKVSELAMKAMCDRLKLQGYSESTCKTYTTQFDLFLRFYKYSDPLDLEEVDITNYLLHLTTNRKLSRSSLNQAINAIKFFYEKIARQERRTYYIERPLQETKLPGILSEEEVVRLITVTTNSKHRLMLMLTYSGGLRRSEILNLRIGDVDPDRGNIFVRGGKGRKDRTTTLSSKVIKLFCKYLEIYQPVYWLFEGTNKARYSETSFQKIFRRAMRVAGIRKEASLHTLRHSFATHLIEAGASTRHVQALLGHNSLKTTERYLHVTKFALDRLRSPLDRLNFPDELEQGDGAQ